MEGPPSVMGIRGSGFQKRRGRHKRGDIKCLGGNGRSRGKRDRRGHNQGGSGEQGGGIHPQRWGRSRGWLVGAGGTV